MDINKILADLRDEYNRVILAIQALEQIADLKAPMVRKRGRPPGSRNKPKQMAEPLN